ncbi:hypothetical protein ABT095_05725 [Kitasatospora sp. NPDC002227]|uniref:hypothetical protein n=1 Tax=Kitasatospora sp. NPDC002227 TaxID=3154773 RepID=UPI0033236E6D
MVSLFSADQLRTVAAPAAPSTATGAKPKRRPPVLLPEELTPSVPAARPVSRAATGRLTEGQPSAGLGVQYDPTGAVVAGGPRTWRFSGSAGTRLGEILLGHRKAEEPEAELLQTLGLWEAVDPELAAAQRAAFPDTDVSEGVLRFCGRWAPTTRQHASGAGAVAAWRRLRPVVVGDSLLAQALVRELALGWPGAESGGEPAEEVLVVVDGETTDESRAQLPVASWGGTVSVGPWTAPGTTPCVICTAARRGRSATCTEAAEPDLDLLAALVVGELVHTAAGIGRGARPGLIVEHTPATGETQAYPCRHDG